MGAVAAAIHDSARHFGCEVRTEARVTRILTRGGCAEGVVLESGEELRAPVVIIADGANSLLAEAEGLREIVATGTPEDVAANERSHTGHYLKAMLNPERVAAE